MIRKRKPADRRAYVWLPWLIPVSEQIAARRARPLHAVAHAAVLEDEAVDFRRGQPAVRPVLAQLQGGHAVEIADGEVSHAAFPVEGECAAAVDACRRRDGGADAQV